MGFNCITCARRSGACSELKGRVLVYYVYVDEPGRIWSQQEMDSIFETHVKMDVFVTFKARQNGVSLDFSYNSSKLACDEVITQENFKMLPALFTAMVRLPSLSDFIAYMKQVAHVDQVAIVFELHKGARSFAFSSKEENRSDGFPEYVIMYDEDDVLVLTHELLHLFGAADLYMPERIAVLSRKLYPNSIMLSSQNDEIDDLTSYMIGWKSYLTPDAQRIVSAGEYPSFEAFIEEHNKHFFEKNAVRTEKGSVYYGEIRSGQYWGKGKLVFNDGLTYEGDFAYGTFNGHGKVTYPNGACFEGEFKDGKVVSHSSLILPDGSVYDGGSEKGKPNGEGRLTYPNGAVYEGGFIDGECFGHGKLSFPSGAYYEGEFEGNVYPIVGRLTYADGTVYDGAFDDDGKPIGMGTSSEKAGKGETGKTDYRYRETLANGTVYEAEWANGQPTGRGRLIYTNGSVYEGTVVSGKAEGSGTLCYKNGTVYIGDFHNDRPDGNGRMVHSGGWVFDGWFEKGRMTDRGTFRDKTGRVRRIRVENNKIYFID